jgi:hypothetical protein
MGDTGNLLTDAIFSLGAWMLFLIVVCVALAIAIAAVMYAAFAAVLACAWLRRWLGAMPRRIFSRSQPEIES